MKQGELESIFNNERYSEVPFLKDELAPIEHQASSSPEAAFAEMNQLPKLQCALVKAFMEKYPGGAMSIDVLDAGQPSGLLVEFPKVGFKSDQALVSEAGEAFSSVKEELSGALAKVKGVDLTSDYPEGKELFDALSTERKTLLDSLEEAIGICARLQLLTNGTRGEWFAGRENLHKAYAKTKESHNDKQGSSELAELNSLPKPGFKSCNISWARLPHSSYCLCQVCAKEIPSPYVGSGKEVPWTAFPQLIGHIRLARRTRPPLDRTRICAGRKRQKILRARLKTP